MKFEKVDKGLINMTFNQIGVGECFILLNDPLQHVPFMKIRNPAHSQFNLGAVWLALNLMRGDVDHNIELETPVICCDSILKWWPK